MECLRCFICGMRIGKGNQTSMPMHERMEKLISVSQTVEHSSTIISDILSRILNETVMREETICRICFNLLNDIDYHLKEAQEKTDEITNKFLDKEKDPLSYRPQPIVSAEKDVAETSELSLSPHKQNVTHNKENIVVERTSLKRRHGSASSKRKSKRSNVEESRKSKTSSTFLSNDTDSTLTEDEMSVNIINRNKAKLLSHVLNPSKKLRKIEFKDSEDEEEEEVGKEGNSEKEKDSKNVENNRRHKKSGSSSKSKKTKNEKSRTSSRQKRKPLISASTSDDDDDDDTKPGLQTGELTTVNMDELTDLFSKPKVYFAKKSNPAEGSRAAAAEAKSVKRSESSEVAKADLVIDDKFPVTCQICFKTFKRGTNLQLHKEKVHNLHEQPAVSNIPETHKCTICPREFTNPRSLAAHQMDHEGISDEEEQVVEKKPVVAKPKVDATRGEVKASCPICFKTFRRLFNMRTHINRVHEKVKPFVCSICEKSFATNSDLKQHMVVHGQGKMFTCETCGREFSNRDSIILHRKQHTQKRTHFCQICNKGFYKASCLNRHLRSHTGERPYQCMTCKKSFSQSTTLKAHVAKCNGKGKLKKETDANDEDEEEIFLAV